MISRDFLCPRYRGIPGPAPPPASLPEGSFPASPRGNKHGMAGRAPGKAPPRCARCASSLPAYIREPPPLPAGHHPGPPGCGAHILLLLLLLPPLPLHGPAGDDERSSPGPQPTQLPCRAAHSCSGVSRPPIVGRRMAQLCCTPPHPPTCSGVSCPL